MNTDPTIAIGWTTVATREAAEALARGLLDARLVACVQLDGPVTSYFRWQGEVAAEPEYRLAVKFPATHAEALRDWLDAHHPYDTPQWVAVRVADAHPHYAAWVHEST